MQNLRQAYGVAAAAEELGIGKRTLEYLLEKGELPSFKPSGVNRRLIKGTDLAAYIERQQPVPVGPATGSAD